MAITKAKHIIRGTTVRPESKGDNINVLLKLAEYIAAIKLNAR